MPPTFARPVTATLAGTILASLVGCGGSEAADWQGELSDSAGVVVVRNTGPGLWGATAWTAVEELVIAPDDARPETVFGFVADLDVDPAGRIYVLDQHAQAVRVFDASGRLVATIGGPGEGPGELSRFASSVLVRADSLLVVDWGRARVHRFLIDGTFIDDRDFPGQPGARSWWREGHGGALYFRSLGRYVDESGSWRGADALFRVGDSWAQPDTVLTFSYAETDLGGPGAPAVPLVVNAPTWTSTEGGGLAWTTLGSDRVRIHGADGALARIVSRDAWMGREPGPDEQRELVELMGDKLVMLGGSRSVVETMEVTQPRRLPAVTTVRSGPRGTLWVQRMGRVSDVHAMALNTPDPPVAWGGSAWDVLDASGRFLGTVELPSRFRLMRLGEAAIYGVRTDDLGADAVMRLRLVIPEG